MRQYKRRNREETEYGRCWEMLQDGVDEDEAEDDDWMLCYRTKRGYATLAYEDCGTWEGKLSEDAVWEALPGYIYSDWSNEIAQRLDAAGIWNHQLADDPWDMQAIIVRTEDLKQIRYLMSHDWVPAPIIHEVSGHSFHGRYTIRLRGPAGGSELSEAQCRKVLDTLCGVSGCKCGGSLRYGDGPDYTTARVVANEPCSDWRIEPAPTPETDPGDEAEQRRMDGTEVIA